MNIEIGANIRRLRLARSMTQEQLAQKLNLTPQAVSKWESGVGMPDIQLLPELSVLLGATIDELFSMADDARFDRVEAMLEDVRFLPDGDFAQTERWLKERRQDAAAAPLFAVNGNPLLTSLRRMQTFGWDAARESR